MTRFSILIGIIFLVSCSTASKQGKVVKPLIRYVNLKLIYENMTASSRRVQNIKYEYSMKEKLLNTLIQKKEVNPVEKQKIERLKKRLKSLKNQEHIMKSKIYRKIKIAMKRIANKYNIDFILNLGSDVLYSKKNYDITEDVLFEIKKLNKRSAPVLR